MYVLLSCYISGGMLVVFCIEIPLVASLLPYSIRFFLLFFLDGTVFHREHFSFDMAPTISISFRLPVSFSVRKSTSDIIVIGDFLFIFQH